MAIKSQLLQKTNRIDGIEQIFHRFFSFGYENINSKKTESKDAFGVKRGSYEYVDANGVLQIVNYIAEPVNGFGVSGTDP